jgi:hypothetical protein
MGSVGDHRILISLGCVQDHRILIDLGCVQDHRILIDLGRVQHRRILIDLTVAQAISHPAYRGNSNNYLSDIAILRLQEPALFNDFVRPACIATEVHSGLIFRDLMCRFRCRNPRL